MENGNLVIDSGVKRIMINGDPKNYIQFNPTDVSFAENFQALKRGILDGIQKFRERADELESQKKGVDDAGLNEIEKKGITLRREFCVYSREQFDKLFGEGTSQKAFGDLMSESAIISFMEGISPYIEVVRAEKVRKYAPPTPPPPVIKPDRKRRVR